MPYLDIQTNAALTPAQEESLLARAAPLVSEALGKDERFFMGAVHHRRGMLFAASPAPLAFIELKALGLPAAAAGDLAAGLCALVHEELAVPADRIYVTFQDVARGMWGWNGTIF